MTAMERSRILRRAVDILRERNDELARLETLDTGKAYSETSTVDIVTGADVLNTTQDLQQLFRANKFHFANQVSFIHAVNL